VKVYLSGPVTGKPDNNRAAFRKAAKRILKKCSAFGLIEIVNPVEKIEALFHNAARPPRWNECMKYDITLMMGCSCVFFLPGYTESKGANLEWMLAAQLEIPCAATLSGLRKIIKKLQQEEAHGNQTSAAHQE
jgi:hypothetical protein